MDHGTERSRSGESDDVRRPETSGVEPARGGRSFDAEREALAAASGVHEPEALERLLAVGVRRESLDALSLAPLVAIAWADGSVAVRERDEIRAAARAEGLPPAASALLDEWLGATPDPRLLGAWESFLAAQTAGAPTARRQEIRERLRTRALRVARAAGGFFGVGRVSNEESQVLARVERAFYSLRGSSAGAPA